MIKRILTICVLFLCFTASIFSYVNVSSCQEINESILDSTREVRLNQSVVYTGADTVGTSCFEFKVNNTIFNCQSNLLDGSSKSNVYGFRLESLNNNTISNCILDDFGTNIGIKYSTNINFNSIQILTTSNEKGIYLYNSNYSSFIGVMINNTYDGVYLSNSHNNLFKNINAYSISDYLFYIKDSSNNIFDNFRKEDGSYGFNFYMNSTNNTIKNGYLSPSQWHENINFYSYGSNPYPSNNIFYNNYLGNVSDITSSNWTLTPNYFNLSNSGNQYVGVGSFSGKYCFDDPINISCDYYPSLYGATTSSTGSNSIFPFQNITSIILSILILFTYLFLS